MRATSKHLSSNAAAVKGGITQRIITVASTQSIVLATTTKVSSANWGSTFSGTNEWTRLIALYQVYRVRKIVAKVLCLPMFSTTAGLVPISGVVAHDPTADATVSGTVYEYTNMANSRVFASDSNSKWISCAIMDKANVKANTSNYTTIGTLGVWDSVDHVGNLLGYTIFACEQPSGWTYTATQVVLRILMEFHIDFREPIDYNISLAPTEFRLTDLPQKDDAEKKVIKVYEPRSDVGFLAPQSPLLKPTLKRPEKVLDKPEIEYVEVERKEPSRQMSLPPARRPF